MRSKQVISMPASVPLAHSHEVRHRIPETATTHPPSERAVPWEVCTLILTTPAAAREAERVLSAAVAGAGLPETVPAAATIEASRGTPVPARAEQVLRQAVHTARTPVPLPSSTSGPYLLPLREGAEKDLGRFFETCLSLTAEPGDPEACRAFEDSLFRLCILMGQPFAPEALCEAVQYTAG
ncbi:DUF5133 domain-containing protein [Streptomyces sp. NBC_01214]|uniref:DUF5133 domain-containing protein n=1 Tax=Streptomyces sp. NBC_01214 TaxID=2903777 RepID=UPI002252C105|nr:DUF5133 domain-containing protein [Streptomyces sp. NBC_01214]MCX4804556.1 DUF5133 domain-containing protein [Streptomyces sp. NBC_01214]